MRIVVASLLAASLMIGVPAFTRADDNDQPSGAAKNSKTATASVAQPAKAAAPAAAAPSALEVEFQQLREMVETQNRELETQREKIDALEKQLNVTTAASSEKLTVAPAKVSASLSEPATSASAASPASVTQPIAAVPQKEIANANADAPPQIHIGSAYITPVGFLDLTGVWRSHDGGSGIGTNFASIPYGPTAFQNHLSEFRLSMQNSRVGFRVDALVKGAHVIGYMESDFLGNNPGNVAVTSNSNTLRSRLYWADIQKGRWELLAGQTWSLITPGRTGISPLPGNLFYSQDIDVNYQPGLVWGRIPEVRLVFHPSNKAALAVALDNPEQYVGGSAGGSPITFPANTTVAGAYSGGELNTGATTLAVPNVAPDIIVKLALDPVSKFHIEVGGVERQFKVWNPVTGVKFSNTGGGAFVNLNFELFKGFRLLTNNFFSDGGGRYIFGQVPDLIVRSDGSLSLIHTGSTVSGFEYTHKNSLFYAYYGGIYVQRNVAFDANGTTRIGYGYAGSPSSQNRAIQEGSLGFNQTLWKDAKYGALNFMGQYSYLTRNPWFIAAGSAKDAHLSMAFLNLRYTLPGSAPAMK